MSEAKFTKGPWIVRESMTQIGKCYRVGTDAVIECGHGAALLYDDNSSLNPHGEGVQNANAKLISAAPELYEALLGAQEELRLIRMKDTNAVYDPTIRIRIEAALAKATH